MEQLENIKKIMDDDDNFNFKLFQFTRRPRFKLC